MASRKDWVTCKKCGKLAVTDTTVIPHEIGTSKKMRCDDCADETGHAQMCRGCCPSGHHTRWQMEN